MIHQASTKELADKYETKTTILLIVLHVHTIHEVKMVGIMSYHMRTNDLT